LDLRLRLQYSRSPIILLVILLMVFHQAIYRCSRWTGYDDHHGGDLHSIEHVFSCHDPMGEEVPSKDSSELSHNDKRASQKW
jgi:hypothetical protein